MRCGLTVYCRAQMPDTTREQTSPTDDSLTSFIAAEDRRKSDPQAPSFAGRECPVRVGADVGVVTAGDDHDVAGDPVEVHRCRSDNTLSSVDESRTVVDRRGRPQIQPSLCSGHQRVLVEINRQQIGRRKPLCHMPARSLHSFR